MLKKEDAIKTKTDKYGTKTYIFKCIVCNSELNVRKAYFSTHSKKCISCVKKKRPYESIYNILIYNLKRKNRKCDISYDDFLIYTTVNKCHYCEDKIKWTKFLIKTEYDNECYYLDRKDNTLDYLKENVVVCCTKCNVLKGNRFTYEEFILLSPSLKQIRLDRGSNGS